MNQGRSTSMARCAYRRVSWANTCCVEGGACKRGTEGGVQGKRERGRVQGKGGREGGMALGSHHTQMAPHSDPFTHSTYLLHHPPSLHDPPHSLPTCCTALRHASMTSRSAKASAVPCTRSDWRFIHLEVQGGGEEPGLSAPCPEPGRTGASSTWRGGREEQGLSASYLTGIRMEIDKDGRRKRRGESPSPRNAGGEIPPPRNSLVEEVLVCACSHCLQKEGAGGKRQDTQR